MIFARFGVDGSHVAPAAHNGFWEVSVRPEAEGSSPLLIREARPSDAEELIVFVRRMIRDPGIDLALSPGEFVLTPKQESRLLADYAASDNSIYLVAEMEGTIGGTLVCTGSKRRVNRHRATLGGLCVAPEWRSRGIGSALIENALQWAKATDIVTRLELYVFAENWSAI